MIKNKHEYIQKVAIFAFDYGTLSYVKCPMIT